MRSAIDSGMTKLKVKASKYFVSGNLKGITVDFELSMANLESANDYMRFAHAHAEKPVSPCVGSDAYVIFGARIVAE